MSDTEEINTLQKEIKDLSIKLKEIENETAKKVKETSTDTQVDVKETSTNTEVDVKDSEVDTESAEEGYILYFMKKLGIVDNGSPSENKE